MISSITEFPNAVKRLAGRQLRYIFSLDEFAARRAKLFDKIGQNAPLAETEPNYKQ